jgi:hypothetical protein
MGWLTCEAASTKIIASTRDGQVFALVHDSIRWQTSLLGIARTRDQEFMSIVTLPELGCLLLARAQSVDLLDASTYLPLHTFQTDPILPKSLRCIHSKRKQLHCGSGGLTFLTLAYLNSYTRDLVVQTYQPQQDREATCIEQAKKHDNDSCSSWLSAKETRRVIEAPGSWEALPMGFVLGVRRKPLAKHYHNGTPPATPTMANLRRRHPQHPKKLELQSNRARADWEVWMLSQIGRIETWETIPLSAKDVEDEHLFINHLGPLVRIGRSSLALGLGNVIKVIMVGHERFEVEKDASVLDGSLRTTPGRRRNKPSTLRGRPPGLA